MRRPMLALLAAAPHAGARHAHAALDAALDGRALSRRPARVGGVAPAADRRPSKAERRAGPCAGQRPSSERRRCYVGVPPCRAARLPRFHDGVDANGVEARWRCWPASIVAAGVGRGRPRRGSWTSTAAASTSARARRGPGASMRRRIGDSTTVLPAASGACSITPAHGPPRSTGDTAAAAEAQQLHPARSYEALSATRGWCVDPVAKRWLCRASVPGACELDARWVRLGVDVTDGHASRLLHGPRARCTADGPLQVRDQAAARVHPTSVAAHGGAQASPSVTCAAYRERADARRPITRAECRPRGVIDAPVTDGEHSAQAVVAC